MCEVVEDHHADGKLTPKQYSHPMALAAGQTKPNRSGQIMKIQMMLIQTCHIISDPAST